ncbi:MAG: TetR/AcrR family transcriptional regulator [Solirubrobacteraceae bacterium]
MLAAARELFVEQGYEGTTTRDIASRAGVTEKLLYNNFGTKAELFEASVLSSFEDFVREYREAWETASADSSDEERMELFVRGLFELAESNRAILRSAIGGAQAGAAGPQEELLRHWATTLQSWQGIATTVRDQSGLTIDPPASIAAAAAMVFGMVLLDDLLFPSEEQKPSRERQIAAMKDLVAHGTLHRRSDPD